MADSLDVLGEEVDECCWREWCALAVAGKIATADRFECSQCGCEYRPRNIAGEIRDWGYAGTVARIPSGAR